jgi:hypothetical protein
MFNCVNQGGQRTLAWNAIWLAMLRAPVTSAQRTKPLTARGMLETRKLNSPIIFGSQGAP